MLVKNLIIGLATILPINALVARNPSDMSRFDMTRAPSFAPRAADVLLPDYKYTFKELVPGKGSNQQPYFKFMFFLKKKADITDEQFHTHWKTAHADLTIKAEKFGVRINRYIQFHQTPSIKDATQSIISSSGLLQLAPYDGITEMHAPTVGHFAEYLQSILDDRTLNEDMLRFVDVSEGLKVMVGEDNLIFGDAYKSSKGPDGIIRKDKRLN